MKYDGRWDVCTSTPKQCSGSQKMECGQNLSITWVMKWATENECVKHYHVLSNIVFKSIWGPMAGSLNELHWGASLSKCSSATCPHRLSSNIRRAKPFKMTQEPGIGGEGEMIDHGKGCSLPWLVVDQECQWFWWCGHSFLNMWCWFCVLVAEIWNHFLPM